MQIEITTSDGEEWWDRLGLTDFKSDPERNLDRIWAISLMERALQNVQSRCERRGKGELFRKLRPYLEQVSGLEPQAQLATELGLSEAAVGMAIYRLRQNYREQIEAEIAKTVTQPSDISEELAAMRLAWM